MRIAFAYQVVGAGWARSTISDGTGELVMYPSTVLADALGELTRAVVALMGSTHEATVRWADEPGAWCWRFKRQGQALTIAIERHEIGLGAHWRRVGRQGTVVFSTQGSLHQFAIQVSNQLWRLSNDPGLAIYAEEARRPFPLDEYRQLDLLIRGK